MRSPRRAAELWRLCAQAAYCSLCCAPAQWQCATHCKGSYAYYISFAIRTLSAINASAQAFCWLGFLAADQESCFGQAHSAMRLLMHGGTSYLPSCLPWLPLLRGWANLAVQHDCGEFMTHLLHRAAPRAYVGMRQSRLSDPHTVREAGDLSSPILLDMQSGQLVDQWTHQAAVHALTHHSGLVVLQIKRYGFEHDSPTKTLAPLRVLPGETIALPQFASQEGLELQLLRFRVGYVIYISLGHTPNTGHYQVALSEKRGHAVKASWQFAICNDGCIPRRAASADLQRIETNCYLIGLVRVDPDDP